MPFDPRVIQDDDDFLPDDEQLEMLGAQLRDDARHLAGVYPAKKPAAIDQRSIDPPLPLRSTYALWLATAAAACLGFGLLVALSWQGDATIEPAITVFAPHAQVEPVSPIATVPEESNSLPVITPVVHQGLTGPELEAVLDLLESSAEAEQSVSL